MTDTDWDWRWTRDDLEDEMPMKSRLRRMESVDPAKRPEAADALSCMRIIMNAIHAFEACGRPQCRRERACRAPRVECVFRKLPWMQRDIFPHLWKLRDAPTTVDANGRETIVPSPELQAAILLARPNRAGRKMARRTGEKRR